MTQYKMKVIGWVLTFAGIETIVALESQTEFSLACPSSYSRCLLVSDQSLCHSHGFYCEAESTASVFHCSVQGHLLPCINNTIAMSGVFTNWYYYVSRNVFSVSSVERNMNRQSHLEV